MGAINGILMGVYAVLYLAMIVINHPLTAALESLMPCFKILWLIMCSDSYC